MGTTAGKRGDLEATARESLPEPVRSRVLVGASTRWRERQLTGEGIGNSSIPSICAERAPVAPSVPLPNRGACCVARACAENAGESSPATPGARGQARLRLTLRLARHRATRARVRPFGLVDLAAHPGSTYIWSTDLSATLAYEGGFPLLFGINACVAPS